MENKLCPRCKERPLHPEEAMNSLSRRADIYICSECGIDEAMIDYLHITSEDLSWIYEAKNVQ